MGVTNHLLNGMILQVQAHFEIGVLFFEFPGALWDVGSQAFRSILFGTFFPQTSLEIPTGIREM